MSSSHQSYDEDPRDEHSDEEAAMLDTEEAAEEIIDDGDAVMDSDDEGDDLLMEEIQLQNDSVAHFDAHKDSIFCIAQHPVYPQIVATGGSEGEDAGGIGYIWNSTPAKPVLPASYQTTPQERSSISPLFALEGHTDSINALTFTLPSGSALLSGGLDGKLRAYAPDTKGQWRFLAEVQEVDEINWLAPCPAPDHPNTVALGANDGSVWIYTIDPTSSEPLTILQSYFLHTASCTAGAWSPDGKLLATVSEESSLYVVDPFGDAAAAGISNAGSQAIISFTADDARFAVVGGLYSVAIAPTGAFLVCGGAGGSLKVVGLPRLSDTSSAILSGSKTGGAKGKTQKKTGSGGSGEKGQMGQILADLSAQGDGIETLAFAPAPSTLLAAGSVDGSIALFDSAYRFATRRHIKEAHEDFSVVKLEFVKEDPKLLTSVGMDGVVRRWDTRGGTAVANSGFVREWLGHRGGGEGGGILGFVQAGGRIVTAGDDGVALVFETGP
jgi:ribosome assembly protein SQT1